MHAVHWEDYLMEGLIDLIESLRYLIKKYGRRGKANKRYRAKYCLLRDTHHSWTAQRSHHGHIIFTVVKAPPML